MKVPKEDDECTSGCAVLDKAVYGTKDAAQCFDVASENAMTAMDAAWASCRLVCIIRAQLPCLCSDTVTTLCCGARGHNKKIEEQMSNHLIVKHLATLGPCTALGDVTVVRILNRIVRWVEPPNGSGRERIEYEADPRHAGLIIHQLGLSNAPRSVSTPSEKSKPEVDLSSLLNSAHHTLHRSATMRLCYLALDRRDPQFPSKELALWMQAPTVGQLEVQKKSRQRLAWTWTIGSGIRAKIEEPSHVVVFTDADHAGCLKCGSHMLRSTSTTQGVSSLSSAESEFYALVKGTSAGLGAVSMLEDLVTSTKTPRLKKQCWK